MARKKQQGMTFLCLVLAAFFLYLIMGGSVLEGARKRRRRKRRGKSKGRGKGGKCAACKTARKNRKKARPLIRSYVKKQCGKCKAAAKWRRSVAWPAWRKYMKKQCACGGGAKRGAGAAGRS